MTMMNNKKDDCYFYYYSTCTKGDACPFRHCEAAMGNETVCSLWQEDRCFRNICKFRHMEINKNRKEIPCYWEKQPGGCQKFHCAFHHEKPRLIDGLFVGPDKGPVVKEKEEETAQTDNVSSASANMPNTTNPQLRGVIKVETQESVPSPTHPPVVINPVDDEDDEDDQFSEEEVSGVSPKKLLSSNKDGSLDFGIKTLEEIRLGKALRASLNKTGLDGFSSAKQHINRAVAEKHTIQSVTGATVATSGIALNDSLPLKTSRKRKITERLGKEFDDGGLRLKRSLANRLGGFVDSTEKKPSLRPVRERLGLSSDITAPKSSSSEPKPSGEIRIKTLEEIRQEKAAKSQMQSKDVVTEVPTKKDAKKIIKPLSGPSVKTFSEVLHEKKLQEKKVTSQQCNSTENTESPKTSEIRVKTLDEIRKEKANRMQVNPEDTTNEDSPSSSDSIPKRQTLGAGRIGSAINTRFPKPHDSKVAENTEDCTVTNGKSDVSIQDVTVKSFEEIMREKRLRKQQELQQASSLEPQDKSPERQNMENSFTTSLKKSKTSTSVELPVQVPETVEPQSENTQAFTEMPPSKAAELRVRPKLNVKPSVMKPAAQIQPDQKRKTVGIHSSAVASVKPLSAVSASDEPMCKRIQLSVPHNLDVEAQVPQPSSTEQCSSKPSSVPQSPISRTTQARPRRASLASSRSSAPVVNSSTVDDLEDLLDEFTDDKIEDEIELDPGKGEDDLLLELSKMIDS